MKDFVRTMVEVSVSVSVFLSVCMYPSIFRCTVTATTRIWLVKMYVCLSNITSICSYMLFLLILCYHCVPCLNSCDSLYAAPHLWHANARECKLAYVMFFSSNIICLSVVFLCDLCILTSVSTRFFNWREREKFRKNHFFFSSTTLLPCHDRTPQTNYASPFPIRISFLILNYKNRY